MLIQGGIDKTLKEFMVVQTIMNVLKCLVCKIKQIISS